MKRVCIFLMLLLIAAGGLYASDGMSLSFEIGELCPDLAIGGRLTSPWLFGGYAAARISGDLALNSSSLWSPYGVFRAGLIGSGGMINDVMRLYVEAGTNGSSLVRLKGFDVKTGISIYFW